MELFRGSGVALVTPFHDDGSINFESYERLIQFHLDNGTDAIIACGTTGEPSTLTDDEQIDAIAFAVKVVNKKIPVIAGAGSNDTAHGVNLCKRVQQAGADGLLLVTPYYNKTTPKGLVEHYSKIAAAVDLPIIYYNVPGRSGLNVTPQLALALSKIENVVAVKEASFNIVQIAEVAELCGDNLTIYSGNDEHIVPVLSLGGKGVISVLANVAPQQTHDMVMSYLNGDTKESLRLQLEYLPLIRTLFSEVNPIPVKEALNMMGYGVGGYRLPLTTMEDKNKAELKRVLENYKMI